MDPMEEFLITAQVRRHQAQILPFGNEPRIDKVVLRHIGVAFDSRIRTGHSDHGDLAAEAHHHVRFAALLGGDEAGTGDGRHRVIERIELCRWGHVANASVPPMGADHHLLVFADRHEPFGRPNFQAGDLSRLRVLRARRRRRRSAVFKPAPKNFVGT